MRAAWLGTWLIVAVMGLWVLDGSYVDSWIGATDDSGSVVVLDGQAGPPPGK